MSPTSPDWSAELQEALWEAGVDFGVQLNVAEQVAVMRVLTERPLDSVSPRDVKTAFAEANLPPPPAGYAKAVLASVKGVRQPKTLLDTLLAYRQHAIRSLSGQFGGKTKGEEDALRNNLLTYLEPRGYTEAHTGKGRTDILIPPPVDAVIETKVWTNGSTYRDGLEELGRYIHTEQPKQAYMVVFGDRDPLPAIVSDYRQATAPEEILEGLTVPVIVVLFEVDAPSKAAANERRRERDK